MKKRPKDRPEQIVEAAARLFADRGHDAVSLDDVGAAVGISGPAIYRHFRNKEALLLAVFEQFLEYDEDTFRRASEATGTPSDRLTALLHDSIEPRLAQTRLFLAMRPRIRHVSDDIQRKLQERGEAAATWWVEPLLELHPDLTPGEGWCMVQAVDSMCSSVIHHPPAMPQKRVVDLLYRMSRLALLTSPSLSPTRGAGAAASAGQEEDLSEPRVSYVPRRANRERIIRAAAQLFRRHGFLGAAIDDIGSAAGLTGSSVYRYFEDKEDVLTAICVRATERLSAIADGALRGATSSRDALDRLTASYAASVVDEADLLAVFWTERGALSPSRLVGIERAERALLDDWTEVLREVRPELTEPVARATVYAALWLVNCGLQDPPPLSPHHAAPLLRSMATTVLLGSAGSLSP